MTQADVFVRTLYEQLGEPYVWGEEGPNGHDCSGLYREAMRAAKVKWPGGPSDVTADGIYHMGKPISAPQFVGIDCGFTISKTGRAVHIIPYAGLGYTIEARGRKWGVVRYRLTDPINGALKRKTVWRRLPGIDMGDLTHITELIPLERNMVLGPPSERYQESNQIQMLQAMLYMPVEQCTSRFDETTRAKVQSFQRSHGLGWRGVVGPDTWRMLLEVG
jgi:hypothetical protein